MNSEQNTELRQRIVEHAIDAFRTGGIKGTTMSHIAGELKISKRTLYEVFENKEELLIACIEHNDKRQRAITKELHAKAENTIDFILHLFTHIVEDLKDINPDFLNDINQYPLVKKHLQEHRDHQRDEALEFFHQGVKEGVLDPLFDYEVFYQVGTRLMENASHINSISHLPLHTLLLNTILIYLRGSTTEKGRSIIDQYLHSNSLEAYNS